jgi:hypothetical protein
MRLLIVRCKTDDAEIAISHGWFAYGPLIPLRPSQVAANFGGGNLICAWRGIQCRAGSG